MQKKSIEVIAYLKLNNKPSSEHSKNLALYIMEILKPVYKKVDILIIY